MINMKLQRHGDLIRMAFKVTTEPFDGLNWDGEELLVFLRGKVIEFYTYRDLCEFIDGFADA